MKSASMRMRLYLSYLLISLGIIVVFSLAFYMYTSRILSAQESDRLETLTRSLCQQVDGVLEAMDGVSVDLVYINRARNQLQEALNLAGSDANWDSALWNKHQALSELASLFVAVNGANMPVHHLNLYDLQGSCVGIGAASSIQLDVDLKSLDWYGEAVKQDGYKHITQPFMSATLGARDLRPQYYVSLVRLYTGADRQPAGFIETIQSCDTVFKGALALDRAEEQVYVLNAGGELVYPYPATESARDMAQRLQAGGDGSLLAHPVESAYSGWTYIVARPMDAVLQPVFTLLSWILGLALILMVLIALFTLMAARRMTQPLIALGDRMLSVDANSLEREEAPLVTGYREVRQLQGSFDQMRRRLNASMADRIAWEQQALKSRNLAMQAQINPHFYYNTLSSIVALTGADRPDEVVAMCRSLTGMMRYATGGDSTATLREELGYVDRYLYCMKMRYEDSFSYEIRVPDQLMDEAVPRLIIQPFVENALKYGINCAPPWKLQIVGEAIGDCWRVFVLDNGPGFSEKSLAELRELMRQVDQSPAMPDVKIDGLGLINVYTRWKLFAGEGALFEIGTKSSGGYAMIGREGVRPNDAV